jgi:hypothetical protein
MTQVEPLRQTDGRIADHARGLVCRIAGWIDAGNHRIEQDCALIVCSKSNTASERPAKTVICLLSGRFAVNALFIGLKLACVTKVT